MTATIAQAEHVGTFTEGSPEWAAAREGAITGSRIAAVCGLSPWESPFSLWHRMAGVAPEQPVSDLMHWGTKLEPLILAEYADRRRIVGHQLVAKPGLFRHHARTWQMVTPDGIDGDKIVEAKFSPQSEGWGDEGTDQIPVYYRAQVLWQLDVFGFQRATVCVFFGGSGEYREYLVDYDPDDITVLRDKARAFLASLDHGDRPSIDGHDATYQVVRDLHPDIDDEAIDLPADIADRYLAAITWFDTAAANKQAAVSEVLDAMGRARRAFHQGKQVAMRIPGRNGKPPFLKHTPTKPVGEKVSARS